MARRRSKPKIGRPPKEFSKATFEALCGLQCTEEEIASAFDTSVKTLSNWCKRTYGQNYQECYKRFRNNGKISLRRKQWRLADKNASMAVFLGKNYLDQKDTVDASVTMSTDETANMMGDYFARRKADTK